MLYDDVPPVVTEVMGARLAEGVERTAGAIGYSVGSLAQVMRVWREQPHRVWIKRELARAAALGEATVGYVLRDLESAGHALRRHPGPSGPYPRAAHRWELTPEGRAAWRDDVPEARTRVQPAHRRAGPRTPRIR